MRIDRFKELHVLRGFFSHGPGGVVNTELVCIAAHEFLSPAHLFRELGYTMRLPCREILLIAYCLLPIAALTKAVKCRHLAGIRYVRQADPAVIPISMRLRR